MSERHKEKKKLVLLKRVLSSVEGQHNEEKLSEKERSFHMVKAWSLIYLLICVLKEGLMCNVNSRECNFDFPYFDILTNRGNCIRDYYIYLSHIKKNTVLLVGAPSTLLVKVYFDARYDFASYGKTVIWVR